MSVEIPEVTIVIPQEELLSSIWYSDGSGARFGGVPMTDPADTYSIKSVKLRHDDGAVVLSLWQPPQQLVGEDADPDWFNHERD